MVRAHDELADVDAPVVSGDIGNDDVQPRPVAEVASTNGDDRSILNDFTDVNGGRHPWSTTKPGVRAFEDGVALMGRHDAHARAGHRSLAELRVSAPQFSLSVGVCIPFRSFPNEDLTKAGGH
jgi:hypothetical protein